MWAVASGVAQLATAAFGPGFYPSWYFALSAVSYGLLLPVLASLHVRHLAVRQSGAVLGTIAGTAVVTLGLGATASFDLIPAALFVRAIWWWTIGKMWVETAVLPRLLGAVTMGLAVACFALVGYYALTGIPMAPPDLLLRVALAAWLLVLAIPLARA